MTEKKIQLISSYNELSIIKQKPICTQISKTLMFDEVLLLGVCLLLGEYLL
jgi:hypothetical protein